jgi:hypothetical protein
MSLLRGVIKLIGVAMTLITSVLLLAFGISLFFYTKHEINEYVYEQVDTTWKNLIANLPEGANYRLIVGVLIALAGFLVLISLFIRGRGRRRSISFLGAHGEVTIELENVEGTLEVVARKLPEVVDMAQAVLVKDADLEARQVTDRVQEYLKLHAQKILGVQEVDVRLTVRKFRLNMKSVKPMPLLLSGPENAEAVAKVMSDDGAAQTGAPERTEESATQTS